MALNVNVNNYNFSEGKLYAFVFLFTVGNLFMPWLAHQFSLGGRVFLPIYFFIIVAAYLCGWKAGFLVAVFSPVLNMIVTGMPMAGMLFSIIFKGILLALFVAFVLKKNWYSAALVVIGYQVVAALVDTLYLGFGPAVGSVMIAWPGLVVQLVLCYLLVYGVPNAKKQNV